MLILYAALLIPALTSAVGAEHRSALDDLSLILLKPKREVVKPEYKFHQSKPLNPYAGSNLSPQSEKLKLLSYYKDMKPEVPKVSQTHQDYGTNIHTPNYQTVFKPSSPYVSLTSTARQPVPQQVNEHATSFYENPFTVSSDYKVTNSPLKVTKPFKSISNVGVNEATHVQTPVYRTSYPTAKAAEYSQMYAPTFQAASLSAPSFQSLKRLTQSGSYHDATNGKKIPLAAFKLENNQDPSTYTHNFQSQPAVLTPVVEHDIPSAELNFGVGIMKANSPQPSTPFLSSFSSFQGQVVPIQTPSSSPHFPQHKGASIEVYPTVHALPRAQGAYEPLRAQPLLHFEKENVRPIQLVKVQNEARHYPAQEIRSDVEIINKKKPTSPAPSKGTDDGEEVDEGYKAIEKEYGTGSQEDDDYEHRPRKYFQGSPAETDFKPFKSFPFKEYDEMFGKYIKHGSSEETEEKGFSKYDDFPSSSGDNSNDRESSEKLASGDTSSKSVYDRYEEDQKGGSYKNYENRQNVDKKVNYEHKPKPYKYYEKDFEQEFEDSYKKDLPAQSYVHVQEVPEVEYPLPKSARRQKDSSNHESEEGTGQGSHVNYNYRKIPKSYKDSEGYSSKPFTKTASKVLHEEASRYKNPGKGERSRNARSNKGGNI